MVLTRQVGQSANTSAAGLSSRAALTRALSLLLLSSALAATLGRDAWQLSSDIPAATHAALPHLVGVLCLWAGTLAATWYATTWLALLAACVTRSTGRQARALERAVRRWGFPTLRRMWLTTAAASASTVLVLAPVGASEPPELPQDLGWGLPADDLAEPSEDVAAQPTEERTPREVTGGSAPQETYRVRPGDSLWSIAADHLPPEADEAEIARAWPAWYATNRSAVGSNPHLIHPELILQFPSEVEESR